MYQQVTTLRMQAELLWEHQTKHWIVRVDVNFLVREDLVIILDSLPGIAHVRSAGKYTIFLCVGRCFDEGVLLTEAKNAVERYYGYE